MPATFNRRMKARSGDQIAVSFHPIATVDGARRRNSIVIEIEPGDAAFLSLSEASRLVRLLTQAIAAANGRH